MAAYHRVYDSRHLQADCQELGSAPEPYARQSSVGSCDIHWLAVGVKFRIRIHIHRFYVPVHGYIIPIDASISRVHVLESGMGTRTFPTPNRPRCSCPHPHSIPTGLDISMDIHIHGEPGYRPTKHVLVRKLRLKSTQKKTARTAGPRTFDPSP